MFVLMCNVHGCMCVSLCVLVDSHGFVLAHDHHGVYRQLSVFEVLYSPCDRILLEPIVMITELYCLY